ncbi:MAG: ethanolamine ammonia-lyase reactivating factor EutA, partial [Coriobacteriales bacterium]|jgi:ethanolamine utilization protein EutA|nr:ethanolamine ammonia-lyase reactivating factor EutA [Coriobacteriales bacterium]
MDNFSKQEILSVGIDIGTSTTQLVFTKIMLKNLASAFNIARIAIVGKTIIYRSEIYFTPLTADDRIDMDSVLQIIDREYRHAGIEKTDIDIGAVIITGETARRANAREAAAKLSSYAGDFVVATAGPELESIIAGKGAGADRYSKDHKAVVANIDIGGGTSNIAVFDRGDAIGAGCLDIGGRQVKLDRDNTVIYINEKIAKIIEQERLGITLGTKANACELRKLARIMVNQLAASVGLCPRDAYFEMMLTIKDMPLATQPDFIMFSGGVADIYYRQSICDEDVFRYQDMGVILAEELRNSSVFANSTTIVVAEPEETIRATVVGAGSHTANISGTTVTFDREALPLKNVPVIRIPDSVDPADSIFADEIAKRIKWFELEGELPQLALAFKGISSPDFSTVELIARHLIKAMVNILQAGQSLIILVEEDMAKALGQTLKRLLALDGWKNCVVCIDSVEAGEGDYIDIGNPIAGGMVLPVIVKTLIFK